MMAVRVDRTPVATHPGPHRATRTATRMSVRELLRRWPSMLFMVFMPASYFLVSYLTSDAVTMAPAKVFTGDGYEVMQVLDRDFKALYLAVLGISVTSSFAAMTVVRPGMAALRRLRLVGYRPFHLLTARLFVLLIITAVSTAVFMLIFVPLVGLRSVPLAAAALFMVGLTGVALGTLVGLLVPREFEASMLLVAAAGVQMALGRSGADAERYLPYWPGIEALKSAAFVPGADVVRLLGLGAGYIVVIFTLSYILWNTRTRLWRR
ncbi:ABC transporter permease [Streptosporangium subroseum]|uniref:ABC transporter permease n=1 Tax=Streptosporangium subroseum TaxID=106412 RepID=UPI003093BE3F|nr:ABC transporter permease [Streptosporangium subroseum]